MALDREQIVAIVVFFEDLQPQIVSEGQDMILRGTDKGGAELSDTTVAEFEVFDPTADSVSGFENHDLLACLLESSTGGKSRESCADDCNVDFLMNWVVFVGSKTGRRAGKVEKRECEDACHYCCCCDEVEV